MKLWVHYPLVAVIALGAGFAGAQLASNSGPEVSDTHIKNVVQPMVDESATSNDDLRDKVGTISLDLYAKLNALSDQVNDFEDQPRLGEGIDCLGGVVIGSNQFGEDVCVVR